MKYSPSIRSLFLNAKSLTLTLATTFLFSHSAQADTTESVWNGAGTGWSTTTNWTPNTVPSATVSAEFTGSFTNQPVLSATSTAQGIWVTGSGNTGVSGLTSISGGQTLNITGTATLDGIANTGILLDGTGNNSLTISATTTNITNSTSFLVNNSGTLTVGAMNLGGNTLTLGGTGSSGSFLINGVYSNGNLTVNTAGTVTLNQQNTSSGLLTLTNGTLIASGSNTGTLGAGTVSLGGGVLDLQSTGGVSYGRGTTVTGNTQITSDRSTSAQAGVTYTLGSLSVGSQTLTIQGGSNVTSGTAGVTFGTTTITGNTNFVINNPTGGGTTLLTLGALGSASANTITLSGNGALTLGTGSGTIASGTSLTVGSTNTVNLTSATALGTGVTNVADNGAVVLGAAANLLSLTGNGTVTNGANLLTISNTTADSFGGTIGSGAGGLTAAGSGKLTLSGANGYTGLLTINGGGIVNAATANINGSSTTNGITYSGSGGTLQAATGGISTGKAVTLTSAGSFDTNGNASTLSGAVTGSGIFTVANSNATAGSVTLSSASNTFSGGLTITDAGGTGNTVIDGNSNSKTIGTGTVTMGDKTTLDLGNNSPTVLGLSTSGTGSGVSITNQTGSATTNTLTLSNAASTTFAGSIRNGSPNTSLGLTLTAGTQTLSGTNTYTGVTTVTAGTLEFAKEVSLYNNTQASWNTTNISVASGATLAVGVGGAGDFTGSDIATLSNVGSASGGFKTGSLLGIDTTDGSFVDNNSISNSNGGINTLGLVKLGSNSLTLSGLNFFTGATTVKAGTLILTQAANDTFTGGVTISAGNVQLNNSTALADSVVTISTTNGLTFNAALGSTTLAGLSGASNEALQDGATNSGSAVNLLLGQYANTTPGTAYTGILSGTGGVTKYGSGTQTFGASNTYTGATTVNAINITSLGTLASTLSGSGTPFGTGAITIDTGKLAFTPNTTGATSLTAATATTGTQFTYAGGAYVVLTQKDISSPLTVTLGNTGATGSVLNRTNNGTLILQADASSTGSGSLLGTNDRLIVNGTHPSVGNGTSVPAIVNPSIITLVPSTSAATISGVTSTTSSPTVTIAPGALPVTFGTGDTFLGKTVSSITGSAASGWTVTLSANATTAVSNGSAAYTSLAQGDFLTYDNTNGFEDASGAYTMRNGTIAAGTTSAGEVTNVAYNSATVTGNTTTGALLVQSGLTLTINSGVALNVGDNTAGHQAGIILNGATTSGGTINFGADEGVLYAFGSTTPGSVITGTGGVTFAGTGTFSMPNGTNNAFTGGVNIDGGATVTINNNNSAGEGHTTRLNALGDPANVITLDGGTLSLTGFMYAGRSVVLGPGGGNVTGSVDISGSGALYTTSGGNGGGYTALTGNNTYTGGTFINGVLLGISSESNIGGGSAPITINTVNTGNGTPSGLSIVGNTLTSLTNPINFTIGTSGNTTSFDIQSPTNTFTLGQSMNLGAGRFAKNGPGTLVLTGNDTVAGGIDLYGGTLILDASQGATLNFGAPLNFEGGTFELKGALNGTTVQTVGNLTANHQFGNVNPIAGFAGGGNITGSGSILVDNNGGNATLNMGTLPDVAGAILPGNAYSFVAKGSGTSKITTTETPSDGSGGTGSSTGNSTFGDRYVYVVENAAGVIQSANWATSTTTSSTSPNTIVGYGGYTSYNTSLNFGPDDGNFSSDNSLLTNSVGNPNFTSTGSTTVASLKIANSVAGTLNLGTNNATLILSNGGLLFTGSTNYTISGGSIASGLFATGSFSGGSGSAVQSTDLVLQQYGTGVLTISSSILNGGPTQVSTLTKAGPGTVVLSGNNSYAGWTFVDGGVLSISSSANVGGANGVISIASSSASSPTVNLGSSVTTLPAGFNIGSKFLGSQVTAITGSSGAYVVTLLANANVTASSTTASWASPGSNTIDLNGGTLQVTGAITAQTNSAGAVGGAATATLPTLQIGAAGGGVNITNGVSYSASVNTYLNTTTGFANFTMDSTDGTGTFNMGSTPFGTITINGGNLTFNNGANPTTIQGNDPIVFGSGNETATGGVANTNPKLSWTDSFLFVGGINSPSSTTAVMNSNNYLVITDGAGATDSYSGLLTGGMKVVKGGGGTQMFTNPNSYYTGVTRIDDGVLNAANLTNVAVTPNISTTASGTSATLSSTAGLVNGAVYTVVSANVPAGTTFTYSGSASITLSNPATSTASGTASTIGVSSAIGIASQNSGANLIFGGYEPGTAALQYTGSTAVSTDRLFTIGDIDTASVLTGNNATLDASGTGAGTMSFTNTGSIVINSNATSAAFVHNLTLTGSNTGANAFDPVLPDEATSTSTVTGTSGANTITVGSATGLVLNQVVTGAGIASGAQVVAINGTTITLSLPNTGTVSGTGTFLGAPTSLTKTGAGTWQLAGTTANTYTGLTTVSAGELDLNKTAGVNAIAGTSTLNIAKPDVLVSGGTLKWLASNQVGDSTTILLTSGNVNLNGFTETLGDFSNSGGTFTTGVGGKLKGTGASVTWSGGTNTVNDGGTVEDSHVVITGGTNTVQGGATGGVLQVDSGGTGLEMTGSTLTLNSDNTVAGKLLLGNPATPGTSSNVITHASSVTANISSGLGNTNPGLVDLNGGNSTFTIASGTTPSGIDLAVSAVIQNGALTKAGPGTMAVTAANTYTGGTTISSGTLQVGNGGTTGNLGSGGVNDNGSLVYKRTNTLTENNAISGSGTVTQAGVGSTTILTAANSYSGGTTVSAGTLYANGGTEVATPASGLGTGAVSVAASAAVGGSGVYRPAATATSGITLVGSNSSLISGAIQTSTTAGQGLTLDNQIAGLSTILNATTGTANLTFSLGAGNPTNATTYDFTNPNTASTYLTLYGGTAPAVAPVGSTLGQIAFAAGDTITLTDLTSNLAGGFGMGATTLQLNTSVPYLLIQARSSSSDAGSVADNNFYSGLTTSGGFDVNGVLQNGYVTTPLTLNGTVLTGFNADRLYLYNGELEVVPEPGTWALLLGGFGLLVFIQRCRHSRAR